MKKHRSIAYVALIVIAAFVLGFITLPGEQQKQLIPATPKELAETKYNLGLDLQGGSQLDYKIDLQKVPQKDQASIIDGVKDKINDRVNGLGVAEPNIYISSVGEEKHLIVELAGVKDLELAKQIVGKTIQLEFKTQRTTDDKDAPVRAKAGAEAMLEKIKKGGDLELLGREQQLTDPGRVYYIASDFQFKDNIDKELADVLFTLKPGETAQKVIEIPNVGFNLVKLLEKREQERTIDQKREVTTSHILIAYKGSERAADTVTRSQTDAEKLANEVAQKIKNGEKFEDLAKTYSDDSSNKDKGGVIEVPLSADNTDFAKEYVDASVTLQKVGDVSPVTKTAFGYHIIKANKVVEASSQKKMDTQVKFQHVYFNSQPDQWEATGLNGKQFTHADVKYNQLYQPFVSIQFNDEGAKLFEELTSKNIGKQIAIFVGGELISAPLVNEKISGGQAQISGNFTIEEASNLAQNLNTGSIPAPVILVGQYSIGATLGQDALTKSLWAGLIGFILVAVFMVLYYRALGLLAVVALTVYSIIMLFLIKIALPMWLSILVSIVIFAFIVSKIINSKDSGGEKAVGLVIACFVLFFLSFILSTPIVMTLAGIAGVILSIGMAVDANILIFERVKEEIRDGRSISAAIEIGFDRAWNSIRDSNFSSLITCAILFIFGSSIIQGFAFNLAAGILISMFTAITVTKTLINAFLGNKTTTSPILIGGAKNKEQKLIPIIPKRKAAYIVSVVILIGSLIGLPIFGLKFGLDFTGGTLMELKFKQQITSEALIAGLNEAASATNAQLGKITANTQTQAGTQSAMQSLTQQNTASSQINNVEENHIDIANPHIIPSGESYIIKTKHMSTTAHDLFLPELKKKLGDFEETRFTTVGPTVGESLRYRAILAIAVASIMIILYIAFAFRRIPRQISKWRFGATAIIALLHDLGIMVGIYVYFGAAFGVEVDALFITALLTVLGFSVHDTIVVFDRIREKLKYQKRDETFADITNQAVNETIARSINTSFSVFLTLLALTIFGSEAIRFFVLSLLVGIIAGTYSSIFVASPILVDWQNWATNKAKKK